MKLLEVLLLLLIARGAVLALMIEEEKYSSEKLRTKHHLIEGYSTYTQFCLS